MRVKRIPKIPKAITQALKIAEMDLPSVWNLDDFLSRLGRTRGRRIHLVSWDLPAGSASAAWIPRPAIDICLIAAGAYGERRDNAVMHEVGHMLLGHRPQPIGDNPELLAAIAAEIDPAIAGRIFRYGAQRVLARHDYEEPAEADAERFATEFLERAHGLRSPANDELGRLTEGLR